MRREKSKCTIMLLHVEELDGGRASTGHSFATVRKVAFFGCVGSRRLKFELFAPPPLHLWTVSDTMIKQKCSRNV